MYLHLDAKHTSDACNTVHEHVQRTMIMSTDDPSSIRLTDNRARTGHFAVRQQLDSISPSPAHGSGGVALSFRHVKFPAETEAQLTANTADLKLTDNSLPKDTVAPTDTKQDCQFKAYELEPATCSRAEVLATLAKARTMISQKTVGAESFSCSLVQSFFLQVSRSLLSSCVDLAKFVAVRRIRDLAKRKRSLELAQLANRLASAMHSQTSNGDDPCAFAHTFLIYRDPHVISLMGQKFDLWRAGWLILVRVPEEKDHVNLLVRGRRALVLQLFSRIWS